MLGKRKSPHKGTLNSELMQRIDNMDDLHDYNPYQAIKKTTMGTDELFNDENYDNEEDEEYAEKASASKVIVGILLGLITIGILGAIIFFLIR